jgi:geranylgeranyl pyrophosphate synthase
MLMKRVCFCLLQYSKDKGYFDDITEGKFSFPIIHAVKSTPDDNQVIRILLSQISSSADNSKSVTAGYFEFSALVL